MSSPAEDIEITEALSEEDYQEAFPIMRQLIPDLDLETYNQRVCVAKATGYKMFIARKDTDVIGVIGVIHSHNLHDGFITFVEEIAVDEKYRGKGYGSKLLAFAENRASEEGCTNIELDVESKDKYVEDFYLRNGYEISGIYLFKELEATNQ